MTTKILAVDDSRTMRAMIQTALTDAGFDVDRIPGFGRKRHMTRGVKR